MVTTGIIVVIILLTAFFLGLHVAVTLGLTAMVVGVVSFGPQMIDMCGHIPWNVVNSQTLPVVPLFFIMGEILLRSGITEDLYEAINKWLYKLPGGMLYTNIASCAMFSAISGSSVATAATIGSVALPAMLSRGYNETITVGSISAGGTLGILIPPSILIIMYGLLAEVSIGQLYIAAIIPGAIMALTFCGVILLLSFVIPNFAPKYAGPIIPWIEKIVGLLALAPVIMLFLLVLGTIYLGIATVMESAAFGASGAFFIALFKGRVNARMLRDVFVSTACNTGMVIFILIGAFLLQFVLTFLGIPAALSDWVIGLELSPLMLIAGICVMYFILGMFMDSLAMLITTVPILVKMLTDMNIDLIWFGIITVIMMEMALITPPVGMNLFVIQGVRMRVSFGSENKRMADTYIGATPFVFAMITVLIIVIAYPQLTLCLL